MSELSPQAQEIWNTYIEGYSEALCTPVEQFDTSMDCYSRKIIATTLRSLVDTVVPHEDEAPRAVFDCEPTLKNRDGTFRHDHSAHLRRQFKQDELNIRWEQRQQTRAMMLAVIVELEQV